MSNVGEPTWEVLLAQGCYELTDLGYPTDFEDGPREDPTRMFLELCSHHKPVNLTPTADEAVRFVAGAWLTGKLIDDGLDPDNANEMVGYVDYVDACEQGPLVTVGTSFGRAAASFTYYVGEEEEEE